MVTIFLYTVAASLMWIFMEGLYLHMLVYRTLFTERNGIRLYVLLGWGKFMQVIPRNQYGNPVGNLSRLTAMPAKSDSDDMFYLQNYQRLVIDKSLEY